ncbi:beta-ketoacyl-[acyl-carrier-protein] synthase family protein [Amycolatopsis sp. PS_44_ISF1]|uniref:beta-ketoacyl-[acyl-carrier-protein] synthase family protein n=1 Tax=Amycolatopsis sp. PS_44_ISF1 TaxID=2974917 RepID=UPI0028DDD81B|nr:beta-ketoacyl-[acyl-carrier-protein] synthase family protein [Amycolatopsis sp. PS_44_ISF1]MDT8913890.1 beta-ketoacyl-[acyl-carrier-protein] synthase family protein [Amycolatopsis sp. PS_44_ISF1]
MTAGPARRVVITGMGVVSSIGIGLAEFAAGLRAGRSGAGRASTFDATGFPSEQVCEVSGFHAADWLAGAPGRLSRTSRFAVAATTMTLADARMDADALRSRRGLVVVGTTDGQSQDIDDLVATMVAEGPEKMDPVLTGRLSAQRLALDIAREFRLSDVDAYTIGTACSAANYAIGDAFDAVRSGAVDYALAGGADVVNRRSFASFHRLGLVAPDVCRPFDSGRAGILTGEGAGIVLLETLESALARGATVHAEVLGYGLNCDAGNPVAPDRASVARCMRLALDDAGVSPAEVDLISAHGTGTRLNDITECDAIRDVYGDRPPRTIALKSMLGHAMGASAALATVACAVALEQGFVPPTINHRETDPACGLDCVPNEAIEADLTVVQNNGLAFGGNNAVVVLAKPERTPA